MSIPIGINEIVEKKSDLSEDYAVVGSFSKCIFFIVIEKNGTSGEKIWKYKTKSISNIKLKFGWSKVYALVTNNDWTNDLQNFFIFDIDFVPTMYHFSLKIIGNAGYDSKFFSKNQN